MLGSVGTAVYRTELCDGAPSELAGGALEPARDGLGGAVEAVGPLPARVAAELIEAAEGAFVLGLQTAAAVGAAAIAATAIVAGVLLRRQAAEREASRSFSSAQSRDGASEGLPVASMARPAVVAAGDRAAQRSRSAGARWAARDVTGSAAEQLPGHEQRDTDRALQS